MAEVRPSIVDPEAAEAISRAAVEAAEGAVEEAEGESFMKSL
jgi:hypothetical protein